MDEINIWDICSANMVSADTILHEFRGPLHLPLCVVVQSMRTDKSVRTYSKTIMFVAAKTSANTVIDSQNIITFFGNNAQCLWNI